MLTAFLFLSLLVSCVLLVRATPSRVRARRKLKKAGDNDPRVEELLRVKAYGPVDENGWTPWDTGHPWADGAGPGAIASARRDYREGRLDIFEYDLALSDVLLRGESYKARWTPTLHTPREKYRQRLAADAAWRATRAIRARHPGPKVDSHYRKRHADPARRLKEFERAFENSSRPGGLIVLPPGVRYEPIQKDQAGLDRTFAGVPGRAGTAAQVAAYERQVAELNDRWATERVGVEVVRWRPNGIEQRIPASAIRKAVQSNDGWYYWFHGSEAAVGPLLMEPPPPRPEDSINDAAELLLNSRGKRSERQKRAQFNAEMDMHLRC